jgi:hypothetical protein
VVLFSGRVDALGEDPSGRLPSETASANDLLEMFADKGFSPEEFVALSGAHTVTPSPSFLSPAPRQAYSSVKLISI